MQEKHQNTASEPGVDFLIIKTISCDFCDIEQETREAERIRFCTTQSSSAIDTNNAPGLWRGWRGLLQEV